MLIGILACGSHVYWRHLLSLFNQAGLELPDTVSAETVGINSRRPPVATTEHAKRGRLRERTEFPGQRSSPLFEYRSNVGKAAGVPSSLAVALEMSP
jgi:hypothetical protein